MKLYRATTAEETGLPVWSCWAEGHEVAETYTNNPGFGGDHIREIEDDGSVLDVGDIHTMDGKIALAEALGYDRETAQEWQDSGWLYPWEESGEIARALAGSGYDWIRYEDDFPAGAITYCRLR